MKHVIPSAGETFRVRTIQGRLDALDRIYYASEWPRFVQDLWDTLVSEEQMMRLKADLNPYEYVAFPFNPSRFWL